MNEPIATLFLFKDAITSNAADVVNAARNDDRLKFVTWNQFTDADILSVRPAKNPVDPWRPYAFLSERERTAKGAIADFNTIFLTNRECPYRCTMCDLWKNTLNEQVPDGAIVAQIDYALERLPPASCMKLYNAGNFFDARAIPPQEHAGISTRIQAMETVVVENHPRMTNDRCLRFRDRLKGQLEIAMGLETVHPQILASLNKQMTVADFDQATNFLAKHQIQVRAFVLLNLPSLNMQDGMEWAFQSLVHAVEVGVNCVSFIPTRAGNGFLDLLKREGLFCPPSIRSMELTLERSLEFVRKVSPQTNVLMDLWDVGQFFDCPECGPARADRVQTMNLTQQIPSAVGCDSCRQ